MWRASTSSSTGVRRRRSGGVGPEVERLAVLAGTVLLLSSCARLLPGGVRCPDRGGPPWVAYRSAHFVLYTDLARAAASALVDEMETFRALEVRALAGDREVPGRLRVIVPASARTYLALAPPGVLGYHLVSGLGEPTVVLHPGVIGDDPEAVAHELAHHLARILYPRQPTWFAEGIAQFAQTVANPDPSLRHSAGLLPRVRATKLRGAPRLPAREILGGTAPPDRQHPDLLALWSWVLYHWLWSERPGQLEDYQARLAAAQDPAAAWVAAFPDLDPARPGALDDLDAALEAHRRQGVFRTLRVAAALDAGFTATPVPSADVHVLLVEARGYFTAPLHRGRAAIVEALAAAARLDLAEALREDPTQPRAISRLAELAGEPAVADLERASAARPDDWSAWFLLGDALEDEDDAAGAEAAYRRAVELEPDGAPALNNLAFLLATAGRHEEADPLARRAAALAPWSPDVLDTLAMVTDGLGSCPEALQLQRRAVALLDRDVEEIRERLLDYEGRCGAGPSGGYALPSVPGEAR